MKTFDLYGPCVLISVGLMLWILRVNSVTPASLLMGGLILLAVNIFLFVGGRIYAAYRKAMKEDR